MMPPHKSERANLVLSAIVGVLFASLLILSIAVVSGRFAAIEDKADIAQRRASVAQKRADGLQARQNEILARISTHAAVATQVLGTSETQPPAAARRPQTTTTTTPVHGVGGSVPTTEVTGPTVTVTAPIPGPTVQQTLPTVNVPCPGQLCAATTNPGPPWDAILVGVALVAAWGYGLVRLMRAASVPLDP